MSLQLASAYGSIYTNNKADDILARNCSDMDPLWIKTEFQQQRYIYMYETRNYLHRTVKE